MTGGGELVAAAAAALERGDVAAAHDALSRALEEGDPPGAHHLLGAIAYFDDRLADARVEWELAFRGFRDAGDLRAAARSATLLGDLHASALGNEAAGRGWIERARRLLEREGPCVEWGYWELARIACDRPDADDLERSAVRALEIAVEYGDTNLEARALADGGLALVTKGRVRDGFVRLDEALAFLTGGEVRDPFVTGTALCALLTSCDRAGDVERAVEWLRIVRELALDADEQPRVLSTHCRLAFGGVLCAAGRLSEAEEQLLTALGPQASVSSGHRIEATARLAELRILQGRLEEAAALLTPVEDHVVAAGPLASIHLQRGDPALAVAVLERAVRLLAGDVLRGGPLVAMLVEAELARGGIDAARNAASLLRSMSAAVDTPVVAALAAVAAGRVALASGATDDAVAHFEAAIVAFAAAERPISVATTHLELAGAHIAAGATDAAIAEARAAHAAARRHDVAPLADRSAALLRDLGATPPRPARAHGADGLTARERDVLDGLRRGDSNAEIAARLFLSPKTVEHHVSRVLAKLGVRTRAQAAAVAAAALPAGAD